MVDKVKDYDPLATLSPEEEEVFLAAKSGAQLLARVIAAVETRYQELLRLGVPVPMHAGGSPEVNFPADDGATVDINLFASMADARIAEAKRKVDLAAGGDTVNGDADALTDLEGAYDWVGDLDDDEADPIYATFARRNMAYHDVNMDVFDIRAARLAYANYRGLARRYRDIKLAEAALAYDAEEDTYDAETLNGILEDIEAYDNWFPGGSI